VHRTQHKDVSLPKGKLDPGETLPETAVREIFEETGLNIALGAPLGQSSYPLAGGREKRVFYWAAEVDDTTVSSSTFTPNNEINSLEWVSVSRARKKVSYDHDREILDTFAERVAAGTARTFSIIVLRHAKTVPGDTWDGPDSTRPLLRRGADQARSIAHGLAAYKPQRIYTSTAARCIATIAPVARITAVRVKQTETLSQDLHELGDAPVQRFAQKRVARQESVILCTHGPVLPDLIDEVAHLTSTPITSQLRRAAMLSPGSFTVLHLAIDNPTAGIVQVETHSPSAG
jgi:phosphohistidine phosphatase SixA/predicted NUDIX family NTP pyrophosphohydrolase